MRIILPFVNDEKNPGKLSKSSVLNSICNLFPVEIISFGMIFPQNVPISVALLKPPSLISTVS